MSLSPTEILSILDAIQEAGWDQALVVIGDVEISVARNGAPLPSSREAAAVPTPVVVEVPSHVAPAPAPTAAQEPVSATVDGHVIVSPSVGVFWRAPEPGAAPYVEVGSHVNAGDTLGIVEVMKLMNNIASDVNGEVGAVHVENASPVEFGTPLLTIRVED